MSFKITNFANSKQEVIGRIKINQNQNYQSSKVPITKKRGISANPLKLKPEKKDEKKDESIIKKKHPDKRKDKILSKSITINTKINDKKLLNIEIMPATVQNKNSELKKHKKIEFSE